MHHFHKYRCVVHRPKPLLRQSKKFHLKPRPVTEENKTFWKDDPPLGGSICKDCYSDYNHSLFLGAPTEIITTSNNDQPNFHSPTIQKVQKTGTSSENEGSKKRKSATLPEEIIFKKKKFFEKDSPTKGRPSIAADIVDIISHKGLAGDLKIAQILSEIKEIWIGCDGASYEDRSLVELHIMGNFNGSYHYHLINILEKQHSSGEMIAKWIVEQFEYFNSLQRMLNIKETFIYDIKGIIMDTTSENTGKYNGIAAVLNKLREDIYFKKFGKSCEKIIVKSCCDHVAQLCITEFRKRIVLLLEEMKLEILLTLEFSEKQFVLIPMLNCGQTGADKGALLAAEKLKIQTGGTAPYQYKTLDGVNIELKTRFNLEELPKSTKGNMYVVRSKKNVDNSNGTIAFRVCPGNGTDKTIGYCLTKTWKKINFQNLKTAYLPLLIIDDLKSDQNSFKIKKFILDNDITVLNVCGHSEHKIENKNFSTIVEKILTEALKDEFESK
eukprot:gene5730-9553_t